MVYFPNRVGGLAIRPAWRPNEGVVFTVAVSGVVEREARLSAAVPKFTVSEKKKNIPFTTRVKQALEWVRLDGFLRYIESFTPMDPSRTVDKHIVTKVLYTKHVSMTRASTGVAGLG